MEVEYDECRMMEELNSDSIEATTLLTGLVNREDINDFRKYFRLKIIRLWVDDVMKDARARMHKDVIASVDELCETSVQMVERKEMERKKDNKEVMYR